MSLPEQMTEQMRQAFFDAKDRYPAYRKKEREKGYGWLPLADYVYQSVLAAAPTVIDSFAQQDPSSLPTTDEHNAMLLDQIEELREALHPQVALNRKLVAENAKLKLRNAALKAAIPDGDDRVYASLTACIGFTTDALEDLPGTFGQILAGAKKQHDELVKVAEDVVNCFDGDTVMNVPTLIKCINALRAELEKDK